MAQGARGRGRALHTLGLFSALCFSAGRLFASLGASAFAASPAHSQDVPRNRQVSPFVPVGIGRTSHALAKAPPRLRHSARQASGDISDGDKTLLGVAGIAASLIVAWSEHTLRMTGCGLPGGPFGLLGFAEGISYLAVVGLVVYNIMTCRRPDNDREQRHWVPALEVASGLAGLVAFLGVGALYFQIQDYGFIPEAIPTEGGRCSNIG
mmetsp:Transcript_82837/g.237985  ORF Transcript_82837/g.237985 Transcript_82837/m.237985 type:complete len:209 (-) Transcript_82837:356-982(-)|eukprot:CAMPEP_0177343728 /NCGR_PEP_ID=MMETSP0368-20130122/27732_1 /TAXON_ID=447022 ORGANISM="Scrippsiella hangoei-like, Strain SHHI-4" /NCGR_SAMPLE_ID=MMETSP0368 /ASSEMBLY_ACC=CAM_ASM_000363 /LENGTH=208 /DNA_ID=CAMNT_0018805183 /DNA_START=18 /DNA_END=644 /DNA_ORIENTATION=-